jgi:hypothetical protein
MMDWAIRMPAIKREISDWMRFLVLDNFTLLWGKKGRVSISRLYLDIVEKLLQSLEFIEFD